jgi:hypothetical protein
MSRLGARDIELQVDVEPDRTRELERTEEQRSGGADVAAPEGAAAGGGEPFGRTFGQPRVGLPELLLVAGGLLEVVAEDLVQLDEIAAARLQPHGERSCSSARIDFGSPS